MAKKSYPKCPKCKKWTVGGANYCHHCGEYLKQNPGQFNSQAPVIPGPTKPNAPARSDYRIILTESTVITALAVGNLYALGQGFYLLAGGLAIPLAVLVIPKLSPVMADIKTIWVEPQLTAGSQANPKPSVLQVEFVDEYGRPRILDAFPIEIELSHLAHVAQRIEAGKNFSRRQMVKSGKLSQPQFEQIQSAMLARRWAKKTTEADNSPVMLRDSGKAVLRAAKREYDMVVVGGGWLASPQNLPQIGAGRAGEAAW